MTLDELRADLVTRWRAAFERRPAVEAGAPEAVQTVYTRYPAYALSGWSNGKPKPGARVSRTPGTGIIVDQSEVLRVHDIEYGSVIGAWIANGPIHLPYGNGIDCGVLRT